MALFPTAGLRRRIVELADGGRDSQHVGVARLGGIAAGEVRDALEPVSHGVWMNEQLAGAGLDRAATI